MRSLICVPLLLFALFNVTPGADPSHKDSAASPGSQPDAPDDSGSAVPEAEGVPVHRRFFRTFTFPLANNKTRKIVITPKEFGCSELNDSARLVITGMSVNGVSAIERNQPGLLGAYLEREVQNSSVTNALFNEDVMASKRFLVANGAVWDNGTIMVSDRGKGIRVGVDYWSDLSPVVGATNANSSHSSYRNGIVAVTLRGFWYYDGEKTKQEQQTHELQLKNEELQGLLLKELTVNAERTGQIRALERRLNRLEAQLKALQKSQQPADD